MAAGDEIGRRALHVIAGEGRQAERTDGELLAGFLAGDAAAFGALVRRHQGVVLSVVRRYARNPDDAADLAQRTFLRALEGARRALRDSPSAASFPFRAWLLRIAMNLAANHVRDARRRLGRGEADAATLSDARTPEDAASARERIRRTREAVLLLPRRQREVFTLRADAGLSFAEIGAALGLTENNAKVHFHHALKRVREATREEQR